MSKKYFAKYLPVEGEIKEGDKFIADALSKDESPDICIAGPNVDLHLINNLKKYPKVKLFLCSRDIQVGDELTSIKGNLKGRVEDEVQLRDIDKNQIWFKVVGEISKDANWVKEYDEFDEQDIKHWCGGNTEGLTMLCSMCRGVSDWEDCKKHIIKIRK